MTNVTVAALAKVAVLAKPAVAVAVAVAAAVAAAAADQTEQVLDHAQVAVLNCRTRREQDFSHWISCRLTHGRKSRILCTTEHDFMHMMLQRWIAVAAAAAAVAPAVVLVAVAVTLWSKCAN